MNSAVTLQVNKLQNMDNSVDGYAFLWVNRIGSRGNPFFSPYYDNGTLVKATFTGYREANACTRIQAGYLLGDDMGDLKSIALSRGLTLVNRDDDLSWLVSYGVLTDTCVLPTDRLDNSSKGIVLDYEVQDDRSPDWASRFLIKMAEMIRSHDKSPILYTNPLDGPSRVRNGIDEDNAPEIRSHFDKVSIILWSGHEGSDLRESFRSQVDYWRGSNLIADIKDKILMVFELANTSLADSKLVHKIMNEKSLTNIMFWRNGAEIGGDCDAEVNKKIACLAFDDCKDISY